MFSYAGRGKSGKSVNGYVFSKSGKGSKGSKHTGHSSSKSGKNLNSKYDGYVDSSGKSDKSKAFKSGKSKGGKSRRILRADISANAEPLDEQNVEKVDQNDEGLRSLRRRHEVVTSFQGEIVTNP